MSYIDIRDRSQHERPAPYRIEKIKLKDMADEFVETIYSGEPMPIKTSSYLTREFYYELTPILRNGVCELRNDKTGIVICLDGIHYKDVQYKKWFRVEKDGHDAYVTNAFNDHDKDIVQYEMERWTEEEIKRVDKYFEMEKIESGEDFQELLSDL